MSSIFDSIQSSGTLAPQAPRRIKSVSSFKGVTPTATFGKSLWAGSTAKKSDTLPGEKISFSLPFSTMNPDQAAQRPGIVYQQKDVFGAISDAWNSAWSGQEINLANVVPFLMERPFVLAHNLADKAGLEGVGDALMLPVDITENVSNVVSQPFNFVRDTIIDFSNNLKGDAYRRIAASGGLDLISLGEIAVQPLELLNVTVQSLANLGSGESAKEILLRAIDLPDDAKDELLRDPKADPAGVVARSKMGRRFGYAEDGTGVAHNLLGDGGLIVASILATRGVARFGAGVATGAGSGAAVAKGTQAVNALSRMMRASLVAGTGTYFATSTLRAVAQVQGNKAAFDWAQGMLNERPMSDNPNVQLVLGAGFTGLEGLSLLRRGTLRMASVPFDIAIGRQLGSKYAGLVAQVESGEGLATDLMRYMLHDNAETANAVLNRHWTRTVFDETGMPQPGQLDTSMVISTVMDIASDIVISRLSLKERAILAAIRDPGIRSRVFLERHSGEVWDVLTKDQKEMRRYWRENAWNHHFRDTNLSYDADVAGSMQAAYQMFKVATYDIRAKYDAVVGMTDFLTPEKADGYLEAIRQTYKSADDVVEPGVLREWLLATPGLRHDMAAISRSAKKSKGGPIQLDKWTRGQVEEALTLSKNRYVRATKTVNDRITGPMRPWLPEKAGPQQIADALGTDRQTLEAIMRKEGAIGDDANLVNRFLENNGLASPDDLVTMTHEAKVQRATAYVDRTLQPLYALGKEIEAARETVDRLERELASAMAAGRSAEVSALRKQIVKQHETLHEAFTGRGTPWAQRAAGAIQDRTVGAMLRRVVREDSKRVEAQDRLARYNAVEQRRFDLMREHPWLEGKAYEYEAAQAGWKALQANDPIAVSAFQRIHGADTPLPATAEELYRMGGDPIVPVQDSVFRYTGRGPAPGTEEYAALKQAQPDNPWVEYVETHPGITQAEIDATEAMYETIHEEGMRLMGGGDPAEWARLVRAAGRAPVKVGVKLREEAAHILGWDTPAGKRMRDPANPLYASDEEALATIRAIGVHRGYQLPPEVAAAGDYYSLDPRFMVVEHPAHVASMKSALDQLDSTDSAVAADAHLRIVGAISQDRILARRFSEAVQAKRVEHPEWDIPLVDEDGPAIWVLSTDELREVADVPTTPVVRELDEVLKTGDAAAIQDKILEVGGRPPEPMPPMVTTTADADAIIRERVTTRSLEYARGIRALGGHLEMKANQSVLEEIEKKNMTGLDMVGVLVFGSPRIRPTTIEGYVEALRQIENGNATRIGMGDVNQMLAQKACQDVLNASLMDAKRAGMEIGVITRGIDPGHLPMEDWLAAKELVSRDLFSWSTDGSIAYGLKKRPQNIWSKDTLLETKPLSTAEPGVVSAFQEAARSIAKAMGEKERMGSLTAEERKAYDQALVDQMSFAEQLNGAVSMADYDALRSVDANGLDTAFTIGSSPSIPRQAFSEWERGQRLTVGKGPRGNPRRTAALRSAREAFDDALAKVVPGKGKPRIVVEGPDGHLYELRKVNLSELPAVAAHDVTAAEMAEIGQRGAAYPTLVRDASMGGYVMTGADASLIRAARRFHPTGDPSIPAWVRVETTAPDIGGGARALPVTMQIVRNGKKIERELTESANAAKKAATPGEPGWEEALLEQQRAAREGQTLKRAGAVALEYEPLNKLAKEFDPNGRGIAEEWLVGHFEDWAERTSHTQTRSLMNIVFGAKPTMRSAYAKDYFHPLDYLFGPLANQEIGSFVKDNFTRILSEQHGVSSAEADAVWQAWQEAARASVDMDEVGRSLRSRLTESVARAESIRIERGSRPRWASIRNIPNSDMNAIAREAAADAIEKANLGTSDMVAQVDFARAFRTAASPIQRHLNQMQRARPLAEVASNVWNFASTNKVVTTTYLLFRFAMDVRFWAMEMVEPYFLYGGKAGLVGAPKYGEKGLGNLDRQYLMHLDNDGVRLDQVYQGGGPRRFGQAYKTFLRLRTEKVEGALADVLKAKGSGDDTIMELALREIAKDDPELSAAILAFDGGNVDAWLTALDSYHAKLLNAMDPQVALAGEIDAIIQANPALNEVARAVGDANARVWEDVRELFYGNMERSRMERVLNSPLLYWPISYQIRAGKWLLDVLFNKAGGVRTGTLGALTLDKAMRLHNEYMTNNADYRKQLSENKTLLFAASMIFPMTWENMGVSLAPIVRNLAFDRNKNIASIGPVYTFTQLLPNMGSELWHDLSQVPAFREGPVAEFTSRSLQSISGRQYDLAGPLEP